MKNRWVASILVYFLYIVVLIVPEVGKAPTIYGDLPTRAINFYYLNPIQTIIQICDQGAYDLLKPMRSGVMFFGLTPMWLVTTVFWLIIGVCSYMIAFMLNRSQEKQVTTQPSSSHEIPGRQAE